MFRSLFSMRCRIFPEFPGWMAIFVKVWIFLSFFVKKWAFGHDLVFIYAKSKSKLKKQKIDDDVIFLFLNGSHAPKQKQNRFLKAGIVSRR